MKRRIDDGIDLASIKPLGVIITQPKTMNRSKLAGLVLVLLISGCFGSAAETNVNGTLSVEGQPIENVLLTFYSADDLDANKAIASGLTNANGEFTLTCDEGESPNIAVGSYMVTLTEGEIPVKVAASEDILAEQTYLLSLAHRPLPVIYARHVDTPLKVDVISGKTSYALEIKKKQSSE